MYCAEHKTAMNAKNVLEAQYLRDHNKKVSLGLIIHLMFKVIQQKIRYTIMSFSIMGARFMCTIFSWIIVIVGSMFFATKIIYTSKSTSSSNKKVPIPECLRDLPTCRHHHAIVKPIFKIVPTIPKSCDEHMKVDFKNIIEQESKSPVIQKITPVHEPINKGIRPLRRRISNVERFMQEYTHVETIQNERKPDHLMLGAVYFCSLFLAVQFYFLIGVLISTSIPFGLMFLVVCLLVIVGIIAQIVFSIKIKDNQEEHQSRKTSMVDAAQQTTERIIFEFQQKAGKPVANVKPFILRKVASTCDLLNGIKKATATEFLKKSK